LIDVDIWENEKNNEPFIMHVGLLEAKIFMQRKRRQKRKKQYMR
jgi:hypothetical protein